MVADSAGGLFIVNNVGVFGGGIYNTIGVVTLTNVTISGNRAIPAAFNPSIGGLGGGIMDEYPNGNGTVLLTNSTVAGNSATKNGGGLAFTTPNTATLQNTIVAYNVLGNNCYGTTDLSGLTIVSAGFNLSSDNSCTLFGTRDQLNVDPLLDPLAGNGGATPTHMPRLGSPAIDNAQFLSSVPTDQRGVTRPQGSASDIGSVERRPIDKDYWSFLPLIAR